MNPETKKYKDFLGPPEYLTSTKEGHLTFSTKGLNKNKALEELAIGLGVYRWDILNFGYDEDKKYKYANLIYNNFEFCVTHGYIPGVKRCPNIIAIVRLLEKKYDPEEIEFLRCMKNSQWSEYDKLVFAELLELGKEETWR